MLTVQHKKHAENIQTENREQRTEKEVQRSNQMIQSTPWCELHSETVPHQQEGTNFNLK